jgi:hypothetical protein
LRWREGHKEYAPRRDDIASFLYSVTPSEE